MSWWGKAQSRGRGTPTEKRGGGRTRTQQRARIKAVKIMEDVADQEYVEVQHVADHEDPALSDSRYASNIWVSYLHTD